MTTAEPPEQFTLFAINILFHREILGDAVGPAASHSCLSYGEIRVHSCAFVVDSQ